MPHCPRNGLHKWLLGVCLFPQACGGGDIPQRLGPGLEVGSPSGMGFTLVASSPPGESSLECCATAIAAFLCLETSVYRKCLPWENFLHCPLLSSGHKAIAGSQCISFLLQHLTLEREDAAPLLAASFGITVESLFLGLQHPHSIVVRSIVFLLLFFVSKNIMLKVAIQVSHVFSLYFLMGVMTDSTAC